jgi:hypothetical protein
MKKSWLERQDEYRLKFSAWDDLKFTAGPLGLAVLAVLSLAGIATWLVF